MVYRSLLLLLIVLGAGCTSLSQDECLQANWQQLGYSHGVQGYSLEQGPRPRNCTCLSRVWR